MALRVPALGLYAGVDYLSMLWLVYLRAFSMILAGLPSCLSPKTSPNQYSAEKIARIMTAHYQHTDRAIWTNYNHPQRTHHHHIS
jgi:hypothetical protein